MSSKYRRLLSQSDRDEEFLVDDDMNDDEQQRRSKPKKRAGSNPNRTSERRFGKKSRNPIEHDAKTLVTESEMEIEETAPPSESGELDAGVQHDAEESAAHRNGTKRREKSDHHDDAEEEEEEAEEEDEEEKGEEADGLSPRVGKETARLYSCDACPNAVFTSHTALLAHAEERHADLVPDHARLRCVAEKLCPLWSRAVRARAENIKAWGRKVFAIAAERDAGEAKMREAHRARAQLEIVVRRWHEKAQVFIFGSSVAMGVWDGIADIDFAVVDVAAREAGTWPPMEKNAVRSITELLRRAGFSFVNLEPITHARVPIIKHHASSPILMVARKEAEEVVARSVRFTLNASATREDRVMLEGSVRDAVGPTGVQQVWWNRTGEVMCVTLESTTTAVQAAMCSPALMTPSLRAKVQPLHDECRPELYNIDFDLSFRSFGIRNSNLLRCYLLSHPCARPGAIVLKDWSKTSGVNNSVNGYFTSYAINIMWIYYLMQKKYVPYVDPLDIPESLIDYKDLDPIYTPMVDPTLAHVELDTLYQQAGDMLIGFFYFYSFEFDWEHHVISLNRPGITTKKMLGWHVEDVIPPVPSTSGGAVGNAGANNTRRHLTRYELCIEDPYEENLNLGRHVGITKSLRVRTELYRGLLSLLKDRETESCVFASREQTNPTPDSGDDGSPSSSLFGPSTQRGRLPARALLRLMALTTREISHARRTPHPEATQLAEHPNPKRDTPTLESGETTTSLAGVATERLEQIFKEEAPLEYALAGKAWNWQQLIHRLGYKLHRGVIFPRRELGVRRTPRRDTTEEQSSAQTPQTGRGRHLTESMARDLSRGFMTLTPEWVAWSAPWASRHLRGYSRLAVAPNHTGSSCTPQTVATGGEKGVREETKGAWRGTRRNAAPLTAAQMMAQRWRWALRFKFTR